MNIIAMSRFDKVFFGLILGGFFPLLFLLSTMVLWFYLDRNEDRVLIYLLIGLLIGIAIILIYFRRWLTRKFELPIWFVTGIYLFYNVGVYGMFMGFPVFNLLSGFVAGYYFGKRVKWLNIPSEQHPRLIRQVSLFTGLIMTFICISSGFIALAGKGVGGDLQTMLGLSFEVTKPMIWATTLIGGVSLILIQMMLTRITMIQTIKRSSYSA